MADEAELGKRLGKDLKEGKITLPLIYLLKTAPQKEAEEVKADILLTDCLSCKHNLKQRVPFEGKLKVMTTPEYLLEGIETGKIRFARRT